MDNEHVEEGTSSKAQNVYSDEHVLCLRLQFNNSTILIAYT